MPSVHIGRWRTRPTHNTLPGVTILRHSEPASRPSPLPRVDLRSSLDPDPSLAFVCIEPGTVHRIRALEDTLVLEVSTPELDDVVRLEDRYGREGTSEP